MGRIPEKQSPLDVKTQFLQDGGTEDDTFYEEPPCMCAQQIISTLFGSILGYLALLLTPSHIYFPVALMQGLGLTLGLLGAERSSLRYTSAREPLIVSSVVILSTYLLLSIVGITNDGEITLGTLLWTSFVLSNVASWIRTCSRRTEPQALESPHPHPLVPDGPGTPIAGGMNTPERRLKLKHSGDANDWYALNSPAMKV